MTISKGSGFNKWLANSKDFEEPNSEPTVAEEVRADELLQHKEDFAVSHDIDDLLSDEVKFLLTVNERDTGNLIQNSSGKRALGK